MTDVPAAPTLSALDDTAQRLLGLSLDRLRLVSDRSIAGAAALVARHAGPDTAMALLDAVWTGAANAADAADAADGDRLLLADERVRLLLEGGQHAAAVAAARARLARRESLLMRGYLARALLNTGALDEAAGEAAAMLSAAPDRITALYVAALVALARQCTDEARTYVERLIALHGDSPAGPRGRARLAMAEGDAASALDHAVQALDRYSAMAPPPDLLRELSLYASRVPGDTRAAAALRRVDESMARREESLRARLAAEAAGAGDRADGGRVRSSGRDRPPVEDAADDTLTPEDAVALALPPAPAPDPALHERLVALLHETFGYEEFRAGQEEVIAAMAAGRDTLAVMPTGAGKSLCYQLPSLLREGVTLVVSPLIALMKDQVESLPPALLAQTTLVNSLLESAEQDLRLREIAAGRYRLVYAAPERLRQRPFIHALARAGVGLVVIDEAHCLSMWGHDFRPDYLFIRAMLRDMGDPRVLAMTATATPAMMAEIAAGLGRDMCAVNTGVLRDNLYLIAREAESDDHKMRILLPFVQRQRGSGIVYVNSRDHADRLERELRRAGIHVRAYHAGLGLAERTALQDRFMDGEVRVMIATVAFGMGVDKADVRFIVHYHPPRSLEAYSQESGRAGRDGKPAVCLLLHTRGDRTTLKRWSREHAVDVDGLRAVYRVLRGLLQAHGGEGLVDAPALRERLESEGQGAVDLRVAISILESAGLLRRGPDVPRGATITLSPHPPTPAPLARVDHAQREGAVGRDVAGGDGALDGLWPTFLRLARLDHAPEAGGPRSAPIDLLTVARALDLDVVALEDVLLTWQDEGRLVYRGVGRDMRIELLPPPSDTAQRMAAILDGMTARNRRRLRALFSYLDTTRCRHAFIARHFGHEAAAACRRCDVCRPVHLEEMQLAVAVRMDDPVEAVRQLVAQSPLGYGRMGVVEVLKGAVTRRMHAERTGQLFGALAHLSRAAIERAVDGLLAEGEIVTDMRDGYAVLRPASQ